LSPHTSATSLPRPASTMYQQWRETRDCQFLQVGRQRYRPSISRHPRTQSRRCDYLLWQSSSIRRLLEPSGAPRREIVRQFQVDLTRSTPNSTQSQRRSPSTCGDCRRKPVQSGLRPNRISEPREMGGWESMPSTLKDEWFQQMPGLGPPGPWTPV